ncbi:MAG: magnesium transporter CorA family protein [Dehalococcoidales bacterium]|nr:magnesium transporter CorA family protein [Dehalococcoidales bacterium]
MTLSRKKKEPAATKEKQEKQALGLESVTWGGLTWLNIEQPTERETEYLAQNYPFHPLDLDDCLSRIQRPKIDEYPDYLFLVFHFPIFNAEARVTTPSQLSVFIGNDYLITLDKGELKPLVKLFKDCQLNEETRQEYFNQGSGYLLYRIIDRLIDYCLPILSKIGGNIEQAEDGIFSTARPKAVREISILRRDVISFRRIIWPMRAVIGSLEVKLRRFTRTDLSVYFGDIVDHVDRIWDGLDEYKEIIEGLNDTHDSLATNRLNDIIRVLTILATIGTVLTVVASFYGMNIPLPWGANPGGGPFTWLILLLAMLGITAGMLFYFHRKNWL